MRNRISPRDDTHPFYTMVIGKMDPFHLRLYAAIEKHAKKPTRAWRSLTRREATILRVYAGLIPNRYPTNITEISRILGCSDANVNICIHTALRRLGLEVR